MSFTFTMHTPVRRHWVQEVLNPKEMTKEVKISGFKDFYCMDVKWLEHIVKGKGIKIEVDPGADATDIARLFMILNGRLHNAIRKYNGRY